MATLRLDLDDLLAEPQAGAAPSPRVPVGTDIGHVYLQVSDIPRAEAFYVDALGFDPMVRAYPSALFVSAGGYHHHVGLNTWNSAGAAPVARGSVGLRSFQVLVANPDDLHRLGERLDAGETVALHGRAALSRRRKRLARNHGPAHAQPARCRRRVFRVEMNAARPSGARASHECS